MILEYVDARHVVSEQGLEFGGLLGRRGAFRWGELRSVRCSAAASWFVLTLADGRKVRLSAMLRDQTVIPPDTSITAPFT